MISNNTTTNFFISHPFQILKKEELIVSKRKRIRLIKKAIAKKSENASENRELNEDSHTRNHCLRFIDKKKFRTGKWDDEEHNEFLQAVYIHGNNWPKVIFIFLFLDTR